MRWVWWRWASALSALLAMLAVVMPVAPAQAAQVAPVPVLVVNGRGFGHGVGMAQEGAYAMAANGSSTAQILSHFYPGTTIEQGRGPVRVPVLTDGGTGVSVSFPSGGEIRSPMSGPQAPGFPLEVGPGEVVRLHYDGSYRASLSSSAKVATQATSAATIVEPPGAPSSPSEPPLLTPTPAAPRPSAPPPSAPPLQQVPGLPLLAPTPAISPATTATTLASPVAPAPPPATSGDADRLTATPPGPPAPSSAMSGGGELSSPDSLFAVPSAGTAVAVPARSARYRGVIEATAVGGSLRLVNELDIEDYLRGMGEVRDSRWPAAALGAQAVAARTYALRAVANGGEICATQRCQVYLGQQAEYAAMDTAVAATRGQVLRYGSGLATAVYSANGGGVSATPTEGFGPGATDLAYLRAVPYPTRDPDPWQTRISLADLAERLGYPSTLQSVRVSTSGPSGRATAVELSGAAGTRTVAARTFARALGLRSTLWSLSLGSDDIAPSAPAPAELIQVPPLEASLASPPPLGPVGSSDLTFAQSTPIATTASGRGPIDTGNSGGPLWALYGLIFIVTASRRRRRGVWVGSS